MRTSIRNCVWVEKFPYVFFMRSILSENLSKYEIIWSPKCVADPCLFSACQLLSHRCLSCGFPQGSVADSGRPVNSKDSTQATINKGL